jgi:hypothetical protein
MRTVYGHGATNANTAASASSAVTRTRVPASLRRLSQTRSSRQIGSAMNQPSSTANSTMPSSLKKKWYTTSAMPRKRKKR